MASINGIIRFNTSTSVQVFFNLNGMFTQAHGDVCKIWYWRISAIVTDTGYSFSDAEIEETAAVSQGVISFIPKEGYEYYRIFVAFFNSKIWLGDAKFVAQVYYEKSTFEVN